MRAERLRSKQDRPGSLFEPGLGNLERTRQQPLATFVRHSDQRSVDVEHVDDRARHRLERGLERQALGERARDLVQRPELARGPALRFERRGERVAELLRLLVQPRVLDGDGELGGQRREQGRLVLGHRPAPGREDGEQADHFVLGEQRHGNRGFDSRFRGGVGHSREAWVGGDIAHDENAVRAERPERELQ